LLAFSSYMPASASSGFIQHVRSAVWRPTSLIRSKDCSSLRRCFSVVASPAVSWSRTSHVPLSVTASTVYLLCLTTRSSKILTYRLIKVQLEATIAFDSVTNFVTIDQHLQVQVSIDALIRCLALSLHRGSVLPVLFCDRRFHLSTQGCILIQ
jgi:hypothetical protein